MVAYGGVEMKICQGCRKAKKDVKKRSLFSHRSDVTEIYCEECVLKLQKHRAKLIAKLDKK
jgi:hypothetical protein